MEALFFYCIPLFLIALGFFVGRTVEFKHLRSLERREQALRGIVQTNTKTLPPDWSVTAAGYVDGQAVIASDYFKTFAAALRNLFGGEVRGLERLMERGRREAIVRMLEKAKQGGANAVVNVRIETSTIARGQGQQKGLATAEVHAYGTALRVESVQ